MSTIKKLFVALTFVLFVAGYSSAQYKPVNSGFDGVLPEVKTGSKAWVFSYNPFVSNLGSVPAGSFTAVGGGGELVNVDLAGIGFKYFVTNNIDLTIGLNFGSRSENTRIGGGDTVDVSTSTFGVNLEANYHLRSLYSVSPYIGVNLNYGMFSNTVTPVTNPETETKGSAFGAGINFGFDWYFTEGLSIGGRYTLGFRSFTAPESTTGTTTVNGPDGNFIGTGNGSFMLNVHF